MRQYELEIRPFRQEYEKKLREKGFERTRVCGMDDIDYHEIFEFIDTNRPKLIVEYGSGESTYMINKYLEELNYGGRIISFEDTEYWYNAIKQGGLDPWGSVHLAETEYIEITHPGHSKLVPAARYIHSYEGLEEAEFCIIDGPDLRNPKFPKTLNTTVNLLDMWEKFHKFIPYFIDGRTGTKEFYSAYESHLF